MSKKASRQLNQRECVMGFVTLFVVLFAYQSYWFKPKKTALQEWDKKISLVQTEIAQNEAVVAGLQKRMVASVPGGEAPPAFNDYVNDGHRLARVVEKLISKDQGLITRQIVVEETKEGKGYKTVSFKLEIVGAFPAIGSFVERLENSRILAEVTSIDVIRMESDLENCVARIGVDARILPEEAK